MGVRVRATSAEVPTALAATSPNSRKKRPTTPERKAMGTNTAYSARVAAITARPTSWVPREAAPAASEQRSRFRYTFSSTTIASSIRIPIDSERAIKVMVFKVKPRK
jgi:hypothetical protein